MLIRRAHIIASHVEVLQGETVDAVIPGISYIVLIVVDRNRHGDLVPAPESIVEPTGSAVVALNKTSIGGCSEVARSSAL
jgi:hypothetical protein